MDTTKINRAHEVRRRFLTGMGRGLRVVWPILSGLLLLMTILGATIGFLERWKFTEGIYFAFVSGLTIGYGDFVPKRPVSRTLAIAIGFLGILLTGLVAAVGVQALNAATRREPNSGNQSSGSA